MAQHRLRFAPDESIAVHLDYFPDLAAWLGAAGHTQPSPTAAWRDLTTDAAMLLESVATHVSRPRWDESTDWAQESLTDLVHHLIDVHHAYLRAEVPRLGHLASVLARDHQHLAGLHEAFAAFGTAILKHLDQEEGELFPLCLAIDQTRFGLVLPPADVLRARLHHLDNNHIDRMTELQTLLAHRPALQRLDDARAQAWVVGMEALAIDFAIHADEETTILMPAVTHLHDMLGTRLNRHQTDSADSIRRQP